MFTVQSKTLQFAQFFLFAQLVYKKVIITLC